MQKLQAKKDNYGSPLFGSGETPAESTHQTLGLGLVTVEVS